jgi:hypothetical protein
MYTANIFSEYLQLLLFIEPQTHEKKDTLLSVEPGLMIWTIVIFALLVYILKNLHGAIAITEG